MKLYEFQKILYEILLIVNPKIFHLPNYFIEIHILRDFPWGQRCLPTPIAGVWGQEYVEWSDVLTAGLTAAQQSSTQQGLRVAEIGAGPIGLWGTEA